MLKTSKDIESTTQPREGVVGVEGDSSTKRNGSKLDGSELDRSEIDDNEIDGNKVDDEIGKKSQKTFKFKKLSNSKNTLKSDFFTFGARLAFIK